MKKAVFIDRDGVINNNQDHYYIHRIVDFSFNQDVVSSLRLLHENDFTLIIISNQSGISKGIYQKEDTDKVHQYMVGEFLRYSVSIDEIYYCPHHPDVERCFCRKPNSLMIEKAISRFNIDLNHSFLIGDSDRDIIAGKKAGIKCFKIDRNESILRICEKIISNG